MIIHRDGVLCALWQAGKEVAPASTAGLSASRQGKEI